MGTEPEEKAMMHGRMRTLAVALLSTLASASPALGQEEELLTPEALARFNAMSLEDLLALPEWNVSTASKMDEESRSAPATVFVITDKDIHARGYATIIDVLRDLPGMEIEEYSYPAIGTQVAVRGVLGNHKIIVLVNGMRVNPPGGDPMPFFSDFSVREVEQIEVIYGPGSTLFGQDAINAVINVKTKRTTGKPWVEAGAGAGLPWRYETWLSLNRKLGDVEINGHVRYYDAQLTDRSKRYADEWNTVYAPEYAGRSNADYYLKNPKRWDRGLNAFLQIIDGKTSFQLWHRQSWRSSSEGRDAMMLWSEDAKWSDVMTGIEAKHTAKLATNVELSSALTFSRYELLPFSKFIMTSFTDPTGWYSVQKYAREASVTAEETVTAKIGSRLKLLGGFMYGYYDIMPMGNVPPGANTSADMSSQAGTITYYTRQGDPTSAVTINYLNNPVYQNVGVYAEGTLKISDRLQILLGARVDKDGRFSEIPICPRAAAILDLRKDLTLKAIYTQAYVAPAAYNMYDIYIIQALNGPNLDLKPERARSFELNATFRRKSYMASASGYYNRQYDLLVAGGTMLGSGLANPAVYLSPDPNAPSTFLSHDVNSGENRVYGVDLFGRYGLTNNRWSIWGSYSYVDLKNTNNGVTTGLPGISHHNIRLGSTWNIVREKLFLTLAYSLRSTPQNLGNGFIQVPNTTLGDAVKWPYVLSANVVYQIRTGLEAFGTFTNITNHHYANVYDGTGYPAETIAGIIGLRFAR
jgi:outer membrane cobalamin receptor